MYIDRFSAQRRGGKNIYIKIRSQVQSTHGEENGLLKKILKKPKKTEIRTRGKSKSEFI